MKLIKGRAFMDRDEALKGLWLAIESMLKSIKSLLGVSGTAATRKIQAQQLRKCLDEATSLEEDDLPEIGTIVKLESSGDTLLVGRFEGLREGNENYPLLAGMTTVAGSEKYNWNTVEEFMELNLNLLHRYEEFPLSQLPTLVGYPFKGKLFDELLQKGKDHAQTQRE
jgi:hypothetical protein